jgi:hyperosmotically inducible protein
MTRSILSSFILSATVGLAMPAFADQIPAAGSAKAAEKVSDQISAALRADPDLKNNHISVTMDSGVVMLRGNVDSEAERTRAIQLASVPGVTRIDDQLTVGSSTVTQSVKDTAITAAVKAKLEGDSVLRAGDVSVTTNNGVVALNGTVPTDQARQRAIEMARHTDGAVRVEDNLHVAATKTIKN